MVFKKLVVNKCTLNLYFRACVISVGQQWYWEMHDGAEKVRSHLSPLTMPWDDWENSGGFHKPG